MRKKELFFVVILLALSLGWLVLQSCNKEEAGSALVYLEGKVYGTYSLKENQIIEIKGHNTLEILGGRIQMKKAVCPDKTCVRQGFIERKGDTIVCLPNQVVVTLINTEEELDGVVR